MIQIRKSVFETNSSSTHAICISRKKIDKSEIVGKSIHFGFDDFGWEFDRNADIANYIYTGICCCFKKDEAQKYIDRIKHVLDRYDVKYSFEEAVWDKDGWLHWDCGEIDHSMNLEETIKIILRDKELFLSLLFNKESYIATGNDNSHDRKTILGGAEEAIEQTHRIFWKGN